MKLRYVYIANSAVSLIFALGLLLAPALMLAIYGISGSSAADKLLGQLLGVHLLAGGLITLFAMDAGDGKTEQAITLSFFIANALGLIVTVGGTLTHTSTALGWIPAVVYLLLTLGFGYYRFMGGSR